MYTLSACCLPMTILGIYMHILSPFFFGAFAVFVWHCKSTKHCFKPFQTCGAIQPFCIRLEHCHCVYVSVFLLAFSHLCKTTHFIRPLLLKFVFVFCVIWTPLLYSDQTVAFNMPTHCTSKWKIICNAASKHSPYDTNETHIHVHWLRY